jgi:hypothetical protein
MDLVSNWMSQRGYRPNVDKTKTILLSPEKALAVPTIVMGRQTVQSVCLHLRGPRPEVRG